MKYLNPCRLFKKTKFSLCIMEKFVYSLIYLLCIQYQFSFAGILHTRNSLESMDNGWEDPDIVSEDYIEQIKSAILQMLHLKEVPKSTISPPALQTLILSSESTEIEINHSFINRKPHNFAVISRTERNNITVTEETERQTKLIFEFPKDYRYRTSDAIELWLYKINYDNMLRVDYQIYDSYNEVIISKNITLNNQGSFIHWMRYEVSSLMEEISDDSTSLLFKMALSGVDGDDIISYEAGHEPFLLIFRNDVGNQLLRSKRHLDCTDQLACCRQKLYVSFRDIGWDSWILQPPGYFANFCKGSCNHEFGLAQTHHTTIIMSLIRSNSTAAEQMGLTVSCAPTKMSDGSFIYINENDIHVEKNITNLVVEECGCV